MARVLSFPSNIIKYNKTQFISRSLRQLVKIEPKIKDALTQGKPVVALESTIITHGMPHPENIKTALAVEEEVLSTGALPATIAIVNGHIRVGLNSDDLQVLTQSPNIMKCSRRDLAFAVSSKASGGTTVSATMLIANAVGIKIFATGGIGGVHRNGHQTMDISADLIELGRTPVAVVSSGVKSILDLERTLEVLETQGVCVASYGDEEVVENFPDFYTRESTLRAPFLLKGSQDAAELILAMEQLELKSGILIGVPVPKEYALDKEMLHNIIEMATKEATENNIKGNKLTPYILAAINHKTGGNSLLANMALIKNNAKVAGNLACVVSDLKLSGRRKLKENPPTRAKLHPSSYPSPPFIIGATMLDFCLTQLSGEPQLAFNGGTYHSKVRQSVGGVGHNLAESIHKLYGAVTFVSVIGKDSIGRIVKENLAQEMSNGLIVSDKYSTATCSIIFDVNGESCLSMANMDILNDLDGKQLTRYEKEISETPLIVMDANLSNEAISNLLQLAMKHRKVIFYEPTDVHKANQAFLVRPTTLYQSIRLISPNLNELRSIVEVLTEKSMERIEKKSSVKERKPLPQSTSLMDSSPGQIELRVLLEECEDLIRSIESNFDCIIVTMGCHGVMISVRSDMKFEMPLFDQKTRSYRFKLQQSDQHYSPVVKHCRRFYPASAIDNIVNVSGAGDNFSAGFISGLLRCLSIEESVAWGFVAACKSLQAEEAVPQTFFSSSEERDITIRRAVDSLTYQEL